MKKAEEQQADEEQADEEQAEEEKDEETEEEQAEKPLTWPEFRKANKGKPRNQVSEEWQAMKKQRKE